MKIIRHILDASAGKHPLNVVRSNKWPEARKLHLLNNPTCAVCGGNTNLEVHHIRPFHLHPELELDQTNLITLCESGKNGLNCHLAFGHLGNFKSFNTSVIEDALSWLKKISTRPI